MYKKWEKNANFGIFSSSSSSPLEIFHRVNIAWLYFYQFKYIEHCIIIHHFPSYFFFFFVDVVFIFFWYRVLCFFFKIFFKQFIIGFFSWLRLLRSVKFQNIIFFSRMVVMVVVVVVVVVVFSFSLILI